MAVRRLDVQRACNDVKLWEGEKLHPAIRTQQEYNMDVAFRYKLKRAERRYRNKLVVVGSEVEAVDNGPCGSSSDSRKTTTSGLDS